MLKLFLQKVLSHLKLGVSGVLLVQVSLQNAQLLPQLGGFALLLLK